MERWRWQNRSRLCEYFVGTEICVGDLLRMSILFPYYVHRSSVNFAYVIFAKVRLFYLYAFLYKIIDTEMTTFVLVGV